MKSNSSHFIEKSILGRPDPLRAAKAFPAFLARAARPEGHRRGFDLSIRYESGEMVVESDDVVIARRAKELVATTTPEELWGLFLDSEEGADA